MFLFNFLSHFPQTLTFHFPLQTPQVLSPSSGFCKWLCLLLHWEIQGFRIGLLITLTAANFSIHSCILKDIFLSHSLSAFLLLTFKISWSYPVPSKNFYFPLIKQTTKNSTLKLLLLTIVFLAFSFIAKHRGLISSIPHVIVMKPSTITWHQHYHSISQGSANFFCKCQDSKYFMFCRPYALCCNYSALSFHHKNIDNT